LEIDEMRVHFFFEHFSWCNCWILFSAAPKSAQCRTQTSSLYYRISSRDEEIFGSSNPLERSEEKIHFTFHIFWFSSFMVIWHDQFDGV
jgi:hypothetical protein